MAHKLLVDEVKERTGKKRFRVPSINGKFGISFNFGKKEIFLGVAVADVTIEQIIKRRVVPISKGKVHVYRFDSLEG